MERKIILDFIGQNYQNLTNIKFKQMTIFVYGKKYRNDSIGANLLDGNQLFAYDVKLPRIYLKKFPLEKMFTGLLAATLETDFPTVFQKNDFNFELEEIYSGKNIQTLQFNYLYVYPIIKDSLRIGTIIIYADDLNDFEISSNSITLLYNGLTDLEVNNFNQTLINSIYDENDLYYLIAKKDTDYVYINDNLCKKWKTSNNLKLNNDYVCSFISHHLVEKKNLKFPFEDYEVFYVNKRKFEDIKDNYLHVTALNKVELSNEFTLIVIDYSQHQDNFIDFVNNLNINE